MNTKRMIQLAQEMREGMTFDGKPVDFDMSDFTRVNECGTSCCIAGYVWLKHSADEKSVGRQRFHKTDHYLDDSKCDDFAWSWLDLSYSQAEALFYGNLSETDPEKGACAVLRMIKDPYCDPWR